MISIPVVRRPEQVALLKANGALHVLDSSAPGFDDQLRSLCQQFKIRLAFDAVGGDLTSRVTAAMPARSKVIIYGALGAEACQMRAFDLIFEDKKMEGFWLSQWIKGIGLWPKWRMARAAQKLLSSDLSTRVQARFPLEKVQDAISFYKENRSSGKVLLIP